MHRPVGCGVVGIWKSVRVGSGRRGCGPQGKYTSGKRDNVDCQGISASCLVDDKIILKNG